MLFSNLVVLTAMLFGGANACKCVNAGVKNNDATQVCCSRLGGDLAGGDDCRAGSISEHLSNFRSCCRERGFTSDCDCPTCRIVDGVEVDDAEAEGEEKRAVEFSV
ncbi:hypothetical protein P153DRAFT_367660 [Dothidotthia symphoricarpi CBS 119687]|uniref:Extracellular membrane protein CFEM domain-containing protein n=1 Tax=Dothidotthia symphoricarpi CBS 119687 TaxID=1392245 RepID=A0A6A6ABD5_9PLEO|nr:uncharacterized protein P153DRAFT_367660 [Dothidotthia symphoricarpi CBS 119687]KAF2128533.1 hypothetical protein P153DRAFT_367660 [Dothidotthia symphoricarpi CBS 119687]